MPRRIRATWPDRLPGGGAYALHASATLYVVPVRASGSVPVDGGGGAAVALLYGIVVSSGEMEGYLNGTEQWVAIPLPPGTSGLTVTLSR